MPALRYLAEAHSRTASSNIACARRKKEEEKKGQVQRKKKHFEPKNICWMGRSQDLCPSCGSSLRPSFHGQSRGFRAGEGTTNPSISTPPTNSCWNKCTGPCLEHAFHLPHTRHQEYCLHTGQPIIHVIRPGRRACHGAYTSTI